MHLSKPSSLWLRLGLAKALECAFVLHWSVLLGVSVSFAGTRSQTDKMLPSAVMMLLSGQSVSVMPETLSGQV